MNVSCDQNIAYRMLGNTVNQFAYHPYTFLYDVAFGTVATAALDMTPLPELVEGVASSSGLSGNRQAQLGAGATFAILKGLEHATLTTLHCSK